MRAIITLSALLAVAACASSGIKVDPATVATFQQGKTSYQEVVARLGQPQNSILSPNGSRTIAYAYSEVQTNPVTFVPVVGLFAGSSNVHSESIAFRFGPDGILQSKTQ
jgi:hypothetical protein